MIRVYEVARSDSGPDITCEDQAASVHQASCQLKYFVGEGVNLVYSYT